MTSFTKLERDSTAWKYRFGLVANVKDMRRNNQMFSCHYFVIREGLSSCYSGNSSSNWPAWYGLHVRLRFERVVLRYFFASQFQKKMVFHFDCQKLFFAIKFTSWGNISKGLIFFFMIGQSYMINYERLSSNWLTVVAQ